KWYLIFHALQLHIDMSPPLFMEVLREVLGDILRQNRKGFGAQGVQRRPFERRVPKKSQLSLHDARRRAAALRWKQTADGNTKNTCRNCSGQLAFEVRARSGHRQGGTDPAKELRHFDVLLLRYLRRVNSELREQSVNVSLHQICEGADSGAPSLNNIFPTCTLSFGNPPGLFGF